MFSHSPTTGKNRSKREIENLTNKFHSISIPRVASSHAPPGLGVEEKAETIKEFSFLTFLSGARRMQAKLSRRWVGGCECTGLLMYKRGAREKATEKLGEFNNFLSLG